MQDTAPAENSREARYILIVESKTTDVFCDSMLLQRFEYRVCAVNSAGQAVELASLALPALVIADLHLPGLSGVDLITLLRQDPRTASLPVILLAPAGDRSAERRCREAGAAACIAKPVLAEELYCAVQAAIEATPRSSIRIRTRLSVSVNNVPLDCVEGECASVLSEHGMYVRTLSPYPRDDRLALEMNINGRVVYTEAAVLHSHRPGEGPFRGPGMGLKFIRMAPGDQEFIRQFIREEVSRGIMPGEGVKTPS
jgi:CheY-like chemotaxis protein